MRLLDLPVAPTQAIRQGSVDLPEFFPHAKVANLDFFVNYPEFNFEKIAAIEPDLIINGLGYSDGPDVARLQDIAPTYTFDGFGGDWRDDLTALGDALGRQEEAQAFLDRITARAAEVKDLIADRPEPPVLAYGYYDPDGSGGFYGPQTDNLPPVVFADVGITTTAAATDTWTEIAQEQIGRLSDADLILIAVETDTDQEAVLDQVRADPVWSTLPAVRDGPRRRREQRAVVLVAERPPRVPRCPRRSARAAPLARSALVRGGRSRLCGRPSRRRPPGCCASIASRR